MNRIPLIMTLALSAPALGQAVYKCPQPDGKFIYQSTRCTDGTRGRVSIQDNGRESGPVNPARPGREPTARPDPPPPASGLRPGEQQMLEQIRQDEREARDRSVELAKARAIQEHQQAVERMNEQMHEDAQRRIELMKKGYR